MAFSSLTSFGAIYFTHKNYWEVTIYRVQTVDFNILANILPNKLSTQLLNKDFIGIQSTLDSNYGLFGIIVTDCKSDQLDCPQQKITYASKTIVQTTLDGKQKLIPESGYSEIWAKKFTQVDRPAQLLSGDILLLRDPAPINQEWKFADPHATKRISSGLQNSGNVIGRVYLLRGNPPSFTSEIYNWLKNPWKVSRSTLVYNAITGTALVTGIIVWLLSELIYFSQKKADRRELEAEKKASGAERVKLEAEKKVIEAAKIKREAEKQIRQATEQVLSANQAAIAAKDNAQKIQAIADTIQRSESKTQQEKIDAQDRAREANAKACEAQILAQEFAKKLELKNKELEESAKKLELKNKEHQDLWDLIKSEDEELKQERKKLEYDNEELKQKNQDLAAHNQELTDKIKKIQDEKHTIDNKEYICRNNDNEIKLPVSSKKRSDVVQDSSTPHHRPQSWKSVKSMLEELDWVEYVRFDSNAFSAPRNDVKIATKGTKDARHIFWIHLVDKNDSSKMAVSVETTGHTDEHAQECARILREKLRKLT